MNPLANLLWLVALPAPQDRVKADFVRDWYVDAGAPGCPGGTGTQSDPFCRIGDAVAAATDGDRILVAPGTYVENLVLDEDLELVGSPGTVLDGSASGSVVRVERRSSQGYVEVTLTGLVLTNGTGTSNLNGYLSGGGLFAGSGTLVLLQSCRVTGNSAGLGGGLAVEPGASVAVVDTTICSNQAGFGGGIASYTCGGSIVCGYGSLFLLSSTVSANVAFENGGAIATGAGYVWGSNSVVSDNVAPGAAIYFGVAANLELTNSTVTRNLGGGLFGPGGLGLIGNSILWDNPPASILTPSFFVDHSLVDGGWPGVGNLDGDPLFVDRLHGDYRLLSGSPCIDAGDSSAVPSRLATDLRGVPRFIDDPLTPDSGVGPAPVVDMGAYEFFRRFRDTQGVPVPPTATSLP